MYDYNFYEQMDRLVEYIWYCIQIERECDREETIRFENLKRTGHI